MSRLALVTLASIVEGEARADDERETIAGVYHNRLRIGMALQADPTVQYAISLKRGRRKSRLFEKDYQFKSPYNTYLNPGLPPGPVNSPGRRSIEAALYPANVRYLYFVAGPDGRHIFSRTYNEHLRAVRKVSVQAQRNRSAGGPTTPTVPTSRYCRAAASTSSAPRIPDTTATPRPPTRQYHGHVLRT